MLASVVMALKETPAQRVSRQLRSLMMRHSILNSAELQRGMEKSGVADAPNQVTIRRILKMEIKTEPDRPTLRKIAEHLGETLEQAFPDPSDEAALTIEVEGRRYAFKSIDGKPVTPEHAERIRKAMAENTIERAERIHALKKTTRKKS